MIYMVGWTFFLIFFKLFFSFKVVGRKNMPKSGGFFFVSNHASYFDPILLGVSVYRALNYLGRDTLFRRPLWAFLLRGVHVFPIKRGERDLQAIKKTLNTLKSGKPFVMFPEGTRTRDGSLQPAKQGIGFFISKAKVPVVPAYVAGTFEAFPTGAKSFRFVPITVCIGRPIYFNIPLYSQKDKETYKAIGDEIMRHIAELKKIYDKK